MNVINVLTWPLLSHFCEARGSLQGLREKYFTSIKTIASVIIPLVILQSTLAPFYVPIIFGQKWIAAIPILILVCLSALPRPFASASGILLIAINKPDLDLKWNLIFTVFLATLLMISMQWGILAVAAAVLIAHMVAMPIFSLWAAKYVLGSNSTFAK